MQPSFLSGLPPEMLHTRQQAGGGHQLQAFQGGDGPSFWDFLDVINPLQHLPIVGTIYRAVTGDEIGTVARLAGGTLYGGPLGFGAAMVDVAAESATGGDVGEHMVAMLRGEDLAEAETAPTRVAGGAPAPAPGDAAAASEPAETGANAAVASPAPASASAQDGPQPTAATFMPVPPRGGGAADGIVVAARDPRFMPLPPRGAAAPAGPADSAAARAGEDEAVSGQGRVAAPAQGSGDPRHPFLPPDEAAGGDWFTRRMMQALDAYGRAARRGGDGGRGR